MSIGLRTPRIALEDLWQQGLRGHELLRSYTALVDTFVVSQFEDAPAVRTNKGSLALVALGGYGRQELYPYSDIDLLLLHDWRSRNSMQEIAEAILYPLWDAGFEVGHSVRSPKDAVRFAGEDFFFQVALLDARFLAGSRSLYDSLLSRYQKKILQGHRLEFVKTMEAFRTERRGKYGSHSYLLEPQIKEGKGGMRDIQAMLWVAWSVFGLRDLDAMEDSGMLDPDDRKAFAASWDILARIRNRLHYVSGRKNDQLIFEYQEEMAAAFGYKDSNGVLAVEHFMRQVYGHLQTVAVITDIFFEHVREVLGLNEKGRGDQQLEKAIIVRNSSLRLLESETLASRPYLLMRLFFQAARLGLPVHHRTRQIVTRHLHLVDERFRCSKRVSRLFIDLLVEAVDPMMVLETMLETGLLTAYLPEFSDIESLAQHDLYHIYTVDRHQLQAVNELRVLRENEAELFSSLRSPHLLYLAALFHDVGKGHRVDHSVLGAELMETMGNRLGLPEDERTTLAFLVRYHLFLPENALRRDLDDQEFIQQSAELIGDPDRLTMLYLLTIADSKATGPSAWSSWKAGLLAELYLKLKSCLEAGCTLENEESRVDEHGVDWLRDQVRQQLEGAEAPRMEIDRLPDDYMISFTPEMVVEHLNIHRKYAARLQQQGLLFADPRKDSWSLLLMSKDRPGFLAKLFGVLALHNLSVLAAQIFTWPDGTIVDVLDVAPLLPRSFDEQDWVALEIDFNRALNYRLDVGYKLHNKLQAMGSRQRRQVQQLEEKVVLDNKTSQRFTVIEVYGGDQPGMLYQLTQTLADFDLDIHRARIATEVEQLIDVFYVTLRSGEKVVNSLLQEKIKEALLNIIESEVVAA